MGANFMPELRSSPRTKHWATRAVSLLPIGANIDTSRLADATEEMHQAPEGVPLEITIKFNW